MLHNPRRPPAQGTQVVTSSFLLPEMVPHSVSSPPPKLHSRAPLMADGRAAASTGCLSPPRPYKGGRYLAALPLDSLQRPAAPLRAPYRRASSDSGRHYTSTPLAHLSQRRPITTLVRTPTLPSPSRTPRDELLCRAAALRPTPASSLLSCRLGSMVDPWTGVLTIGSQLVDLVHRLSIQKQFVKISLIQ
jgi:hypothetical protein